MRTNEVSGSRRFGMCVAGVVKAHLRLASTAPNESLAAGASVTRCRHASSCGTPDSRDLPHVTNRKLARAACCSSEPKKGRRRTRCCRILDLSRYVRVMVLCVKATTTRSTSNRPQSQSDPSPPPLPTTTPASRHVVIAASIPGARGGRRRRRGHWCCGGAHAPLPVPIPVEASA